MRLVLIAFVALITSGLVPHSDACSRAVTPGPEEETCGYLPPNQPNRQLIHGGNKAGAGQWPWAAFFIRKIVVRHPDGTPKEDDWRSCGGTIIDREWILTAGHCLGGTENPSDYCVVVGHNVLNVASLEGWRRCTPFGKRPLQVIQHPVYHNAIYGPVINNTFNDNQKKIRYHDIGLIKMPPISFSTPAVGRICLPSEAGNYFDKSCYVAGWGATKTSKRSVDLMSVRSKIWSESDCRTKSVLGAEYDIVDNFYCVGEENANVCYGDSGGAAYCEKPNGKFEAVGVASVIVNGSDCSGPGVASYFIRVPTFLQWIKKTIEANTDTESDSLPENWDSIPPGLREDME